MISDSSPFEKRPLVALVTTPIGNFEDITYRAVSFLKDADVIACEDTRETLKLLKHYQITPKRLISLYAQTESKDSKDLITEVKEKNLVLAYCSDAGLPGISDPGALLIKEARNQNVDVTILPGPSASLSALVISGIDTADFSFFGFLPTKEGAMKKTLAALSNRKETLIFYESPKRIRKTLSVMLAVFGEEREVSISRELTKMYEQSITGPLGEICDYGFEERGEFVIIVAPSKIEEEPDQDDINDFIKEKLASGMKSKDVVSAVVDRYSVSKNDAYQMVLNCKSE